MTTGYLLLAVAVMAAVTYFMRVSSMVIFRKKIKSRFINSFLYYTPYGVLAAMIFPAVFYSTDSLASAVAGFGVAIGLSLLGQKLMVVFAGSVIAVYLCELIIKLIG